jgi:hypothetical protein
MLVSASSSLLRSFLGLSLLRFFQLSILETLLLPSANRIFRGLLTSRVIIVI